MSPFLFWLTLPETLVTVAGPAVVFAVGLLLRPAWRTHSLALALLALACVPLSHALSFWTTAGLHVVPVHVFAYFLLIAVRRVDFRRQWFGAAFGIWLGSIVTDCFGAWVARGTVHGFRADIWFWGVGGYGVGDALLVYPVAFTAALLLAQTALQRRWLLPSTWWAQMARQG